VASTAHAATIIRVVFVIENILDEETKCELTQIEEEKQTKTTRRLYGNLAVGRTT